MIIASRFHADAEHLFSLERACVLASTISALVHGSRGAVPSPAGCARRRIRPDRPADVDAAADAAADVAAAAAAAAAAAEMMCNC